MQPRHTRAVRPQHTLPTQPQAWERQLQMESDLSQLQRLIKTRLAKIETRTASRATQQDVAVLAEAEGQVEARPTA